MEFTVMLTAAPDLLTVLNRLADGLHTSRGAVAIPMNAGPVAAPVQNFSPAPQVVTAPVAPQPVAAPVADVAPVAPQPMSAPVTAPVQTAAKVYTWEELARACGPLMDAGCGQQLQGLLAKYGVARMDALTPEQCTMFATDLRAMGAKL